MLPRLRSRGQRRPITRYLFFVPLAALVTIIVYGYFVSNQPGTLIIEAKDPSSQKDLFVQASINGMLVTTPSTLSLSQSVYTVTYNALQWYQTPSPRVISLLAGRTAYAIGEYKPIVEVVGISGDSFNVTSVGAKSKVTPVVWVNTSNHFLVLMGEQFNTAVIYPQMNFTFIYQSAGKFLFWVGQPSVNGTVSVG